jgi:hypothetical protein
VAIENYEIPLSSNKAQKFEDYSGLNIHQAMSAKEFSESVKQHKDFIKNTTIDKNSAKTKEILYKNYFSIDISDQRSINNYFLQNKLECPKLNSFYVDDYITVIEDYISSYQIKCSVRDRRLGNIHQIVTLSSTPHRDQYIKKINDLKRSYESGDSPILNPSAVEKYNNLDNQIEDYKSAVNFDSTVKPEDIKLPTVINDFQMLMSIILLDDEVINISNSLAINKITLNHPYSRSVPLITKVEDDLKTFESTFFDIAQNKIYKATDWDFFKPVDFSEHKKLNNEQKLKMYDQFLLGFLKMLIKLNNAVVWMLETLFVAVVVFSVALFVYFHVQVETQKEDIKSKIGKNLFFYAIVWSVFFTTFTTYYDENNTVETNRSQVFIRYAYKEIDAFADWLSKGIVNIYTESQSRLDSVSIVNNKVLSLVSLETENETRKDVLAKCLSQFNVNINIEQKLMLNNNIDAKSLNPFYKTENIANKNNGNLSVYSSSSNIIEDPISNILSVELCYNNQNSIIYNNSLINQIESDIKRFNNLSDFDAKIEREKLFYKTIFSTSESLSYLAVSFLPIFTLTDTIIFTVNTKLDYYSQLVDIKNIGSSSLKELANMVSENVFWLFFLDTNSIINIIKAFTNIIPIPIVSDAAASVAALLLIDLAAELFSTLKLLFLILLGLLYFLALIVNRFFYFHFFPFFLVVMLFKNGFSSLKLIFIDLVFSSFKPIFFVVLSVIALFLSGIVETIIYWMIEIIADLINIALNNNVFSSTAANFLKGFLFVIVLAVNFLLIYQIVFKTEGFIKAKLGLDRADFGEDIVDQMQSKLDRHST